MRQGEGRNTSKGRGKTQIRLKNNEHHKKPSTYERKKGL